MYTRSSADSSRWKSPMTPPGLVGLGHMTDALLTASTVVRCSFDSPKRQYLTGPRSKPAPRSVTIVPPLVMPPGGPPLTDISSMRRLKYENL